MKLNEIAQLDESHFLTDRKTILHTLENELEFDEENFEFDAHVYLRNYEIEPDGTVNLEFHGNGHLDLYRFTKDGKLVIKFGKIVGDVSIESDNDKFVGWKSYDGFPMTVEGSVHAVNCGITSYTALPKNCSKTIFAHANPITSLIGIADHFESIGALDLSMRKIEEGGLGIILIPNLNQIMTSNVFVGAPLMKSSPRWFEIVAKYMGRPQDIFECQAELIEAGFEAHAQL